MQNELHAEHHIASTKMYVTVFLALIAGTVLTYQVWKINLGLLSVMISLGIAVCKATLVIRYFMHVKWSPILSKMTLAGAVIFLAILLVLMSMDYVSRGWQPRAMPWDHHQVLNN
ncbi:MAG: cytochrome C oxidase subunit IV family protein [Bryobacterales bacterium]|nr:cytochrome C oxidase subunit IV family protein [Bryobacterales bacterium]